MGNVAGELCAKRFHRGGGESYAYLSAQGIEEGVTMQLRTYDKDSCFLFHKYTIYMHY